MTSNPYEIPRKIAATVTASGGLVGGKHNPVDASSGPITMTLPGGTVSAGAHLSVEKLDSSTNPITITGTIRGQATSVSLVWKNEAMTFRADGAGSWSITEGHKTKGSLDAAYLSDQSVKNLNAAPYSAVAGSDVTAQITQAIADLSPANGGTGGTARFSKAGLYPVSGAAQSGAADVVSWLGQIIIPTVGQNQDGVYYGIAGSPTPVYGAYTTYGHGVVLQGGAGLVSIGSLSAALTTSGSITSLSVSALTKPVGQYTHLQLDDGAGHTQVWMVTTAAAAGATTLTVAAQVPSFAFPSGTTSVKLSPFMFACASTGVNTGASQTLPSFSDLTIDAAAGQGGIDLSNTSTYFVQRVMFKGPNMRPNDGSTAVRLPVLNNGAAYVLRDVWVGGDTTGGFGIAFDISELLLMEGVNMAQNCTVAMFCRGGTFNRINYLHVAGCTSIFSTKGAVAGTQVSANVHWESAGITAAQFLDSDGGLLNRPLTGQVELDASGDLYPDTPKSLGAVIHPVFGLNLQLRRPGSNWSLEQHPRDTFARIVAAPSNNAYPGICSDSLHGWRPLNGAFNISNGQLSAASASECTALVPALNGVRGGRSRTVTVKYTTQATLANAFWQFFVHRPDGGANNGLGFGIKAAQDRLILAVNLSNVITVSGTFAASTTYTIDMAVTVAPDGLPSRIRVYVGGVKKVDYWPTATQRASMAPGTTWPYLEDGVDIPSGDQSSYITLFSVRDMADRSDPIIFTPIVAVAESSGAGITPDASAGSWQTVTVADATAFTINAPVNLPTAASLSQELVVEVLNNSGGAMGAITWNAIYSFAGFTWANPATGKRRFAKFAWNGTAWVCVSLSGADY